MKNKPAYDTLTLVIDQMTADTLDRNTIESLRNMLDFPAFQPIRDVIEKKIIEVGLMLARKEAVLNTVLVGGKPNEMQVFWGSTATELTNKIDSLPDGVELDYEYEANIRSNFQYIKDQFDSSLEYDVCLPPEKDLV